MAKLVLAGMRSAALVFHSTSTVRWEIERYALVPPERLVHAPYGVSSEFESIERDGDGATEALGPVTGSPFLLHVGSSLPRKRLDVLFEAFARVHARRPYIRLVQQGADLEGAHQAHVAQLGLGDAVFQPESKHMERRTLAGLYRRATAVLVTSDAEGFGLPVIEALACGAVVIASDIPVLREVGGDAVLYAPVGRPDAWAELVEGALSGRVPSPPKAVRLKQASKFTWREHARVILDAYQSIV
jgi:glycosyltransferase involved in cell wall biosynthesis